LVGEELDQAESMWGTNSVGANSPWGETGSYLKKATINGYFRFVFVKKNRSGKLNDYPDIIVFEKLCNFRDGIRQA